MATVTGLIPELTMSDVRAFKDSITLHGVPVKQLNNVMHNPYPRYCRADFLYAMVIGQAFVYYENIVNSYPHVGLVLDYTSQYTICQDLNSNLFLAKSSYNVLTLPTDKYLSIESFHKSFPRSHLDLPYYLS